MGGTSGDARAETEVPPATQELRIEDARRRWYLTDNFRTAFLTAADGKLKLSSAALTGDAQAGWTLMFTGFHEDGTEFGQVSAPFTIDPIKRAAQMAVDILTTHTGVPYMPAPVAIRGLAKTFRESMAAVTARANAMAESAIGEVDNLNSVLDQGDEMLKDVKAAAAEVQSALGLNTNGGPPLA